MTDRPMTAAETVEYLGLPSLQALYDRVHRAESNGLPVRRCGRNLRFYRTELDQWMKGPQ